jgi:hypothetical protein
MCSRKVLEWCRPGQPGAMLNSMFATAAHAAMLRPAWSLVLVPETTNRDDSLGVRGVDLDLRTQTFHVHIQCLGVTHIISSPHSINQGLARQHTTCVRHENMKKFELFQRKCQLLATYDNVMLLWIYLDITYFDD